MKLLNTEKREPKRNRTCIRLLDIRASATLSALHLSNVRAPLNATVRLRLRNVRAPLNATVRLRPRNVRAEKPAVSNPVLRVKTVHKRRVKGTYCIPLPHRSCCVVFTAKFEYDCPLFFFLAIIIPHYESSCEQSRDWAGCLGCAGLSAERVNLHRQAKVAHTDRDKLGRNLLMTS